MARAEHDDPADTESCSDVEAPKVAQGRDR